jgi:8-oxo-dGTP diphosphatase
MTQTHNGASVGIVRDGRILLIKRAYVPFQHLWSFPGGGWEDGESIEACAAREVGEELGLAVRNLRHVMTQSVGREGSYRIAVFTTTDFSGVIRPSDEISDHKWVDPGMLIALRTTSRLDDVIRECFKVLGQSW